MALTDEQRAMLQLLLEGGQGYADIGSLLGIGPDEVRSRARSALREMGGADPDAQVQLSDYLLGQADPIGRADAVRHLQNDAEANALAASLITQLRLLAPKGELPGIPAPRGGRVAAAGAGAGSTAPAAGAGAPLPGRISGAVRGVGSSKRKSQLLVGLGALALLVVVGVLAVAGVFGGDDDSSSGDSAEAAAAAAGDEVAVVELAPLGESTGASGQAVFAPTQEQPVLQVNLSGLEPTGKGQIYVVWLYAGENAAFPVARDRIDETGSLTGATPLGNEVIALLGQFACVDVSLADTRETEQALQQAIQGRSLPNHVGETVLRGQIPTAPGQTAPSGSDSQCEVAAPAGGGNANGGNGNGNANGGGN